MIYRQNSEQHLQRIIQGLGHTHLKGLLKTWNVSKATSFADIDIEIQYDYFVMYDEPAPGVRHLRIQGHNSEPIHNWMDMQEIKNIIWGEEVVAVEVYPAASQFKDGSNTYHLWTWPGLDAIVPNLLTLYEYAPQKI